MATDASNIEDLAVLLSFKMKLETLDESIMEEIQFFNSIEVPDETDLALNNIMHYFSDRRPTEQLPFLKMIIDNLDVLDKEYFDAMFEFKKTWIIPGAGKEEREAVIRQELEKERVFKCDFNYRHYYAKLVGFVSYMDDPDLQRKVLEKVKKARFVTNQ